MEIIDELIGLIVPIAICVVLPVMIVWLISRRLINADNKRTEVLIEAIKSNAGIDADKLAEAFHKPRLSDVEILNRRLLYGCVWTLLGVMSGISAIIFACTEPWSNIHNPLMLFCGLCLAIGIGFLIVYFVSRRIVLGNSEKKD
ncbi:MAG: TspO/MBR family protein [Bacteroidales bacterium]|nr:TspO/MBR family protein [Bacteroidales bacterium]